MSKLEYRNLDLTGSFAKLKEQKPFDIVSNLSGERIIILLQFVTVNPSSR